MIEITETVQITQIYIYGQIANYENYSIEFIDRRKTLGPVEHVNNANLPDFTIHTFNNIAVEGVEMSTTLITFV